MKIDRNVMFCGKMCIHTKNVCSNLKEFNVCLIHSTDAMLTVFEFLPVISHDHQVLENTSDIHSLSLKFFRVWLSMYHCCCDEISLSCGTVCITVIGSCNYWDWTEWFGWTSAKYILSSYHISIDLLRRLEVFFFITTSVHINLE